MAQLFTLYMIVMLACGSGSGAADCTLDELEPGITYPTLAQCEAALDRKMTALLNVAQRKRDAQGSVICIEVPGWRQARGEEQ